MTRDGQYAVIGALMVGAAVLAAAPYLARLTRSVPDRDDPRWWVGRPASRGRVVASAAVAAPTGLLAGYAGGVSAILPAYLLLALASVPLIMIDFELHRLPDRLVLVAGSGGAVLFAAAAAVDGRWWPLLRGAEAAGLTFAVGTGLALIAPLGFGDVKLAAVLAGYLGWSGWGFVGYGLVGGFVVAAVVTLPLLAAGRVGLKSAVPLGPALIAGALIVVAARLVPGG